MAPREDGFGKASSHYSGWQLAVTALGRRIACRATAVQWLAVMMMMMMMVLRVAQMWAPLSRFKAERTKRAELWYRARAF